MTDKLVSFLGIARKAGALKFGHDRVLDLVNKKKCKLVLFTSDYSAKQAHDVKIRCELHHIKYHVLKHKMQDIADVTINLSGVMAIDDNNFSDQIEVIIKNNAYVVCEDTKEVLRGGTI